MEGIAWVIGQAFHFWCVRPMNKPFLTFLGYFAQYAFALLCLLAILAPVAYLLEDGGPIAQLGILIVGLAILAGYETWQEHRDG